MFDDEIPAQCRLCLQFDDSPIMIFVPNGNDRFLVWELITELVEFEISKTDGLPPTICQRCMRRLMEYKNFKKMCIDSRNEFMKMRMNKGLVVPMKMEKGDNVVPLEIYNASIVNEKLHSSSGERAISGHSEGSSVSGGNSNMEAAEIREEEESHKRVEDESLDVPRRTRRSARLQAAKGCDGGNSKEKQGSTNGEVKNDLMMQAGADGKNTRRKKTKGMETKSVSPRSSVVEQRMETNRELKREWRRKYLQSMSEEERRELSRKQWEAAKRRLANMTEEQKKEFTRRNTELCRRQRAQMSEEERREYNRKQREGAKRRLANMTEEQKKECTRRNNVNAKRYRAKMSDEERKACSRRHAEIRKKRIARMSEEEREEYRRKINERKRKYRSQ